MRRALLIALGLLAAIAPAAQGSPQPQHLGFVISPDARFPDRKFIVTLPTGADPVMLKVSENGVPVIPHLESITRERVPLSLAVVIDTSNSMKGPLLTAATEAARTLIAAKPDRAEAAVFGFARTPNLLGTWSDDPAAFDGALSSVTTTRGTAIWDSVVMASQLLGSRDGASRALVLATDGIDTSSNATPDQAAAAARHAHVHVFVVSLAGAKVDTGGLQSVVAATGGDFIHVDSIDQLDGVYAALAKQLRRQYSLTYVSQLRHQGDVTVRMTLGDLSAEQHYLAPAPSDVPAPARDTGVLRSNGAIAAIAAAVSLVILFGAYVALRPRAQSAVRRLRPYGAKHDSPALAKDIVDIPLRPRGTGSDGRVGRMWARFSTDVVRSGLAEDPSRVMLIGIGGGLAAAAAVALATGRPLTAIVIAPLGPLAAWAYVTHRASAWHRHFDAQLPDSLAVLASSLRAGQSLLQAVSHVADEADDRVAVEWAQVVSDTRLGMAVEDAIDEMVKRVNNRDLHWIALVARVQHSAGGNMAEMFDTVAETVRSRHRLRAQVMTLTAQGRMSRWILTLAPIGLAGLFFVISPSYVSLLVDDPTGRLLVLIATVLTVIGSFWLKRIVEIEV
jgi:tight adherence protein B